MDFVTTVFRRVLFDEKGTAFAEFGLLFILIAAIVLASIAAAGGGSAIFFQQVTPLG